MSSIVMHTLNIKFTYCILHNLSSLVALFDEYYYRQRTAWTCLNANEAKNETTNNVTSNTNVATSNLGLQEFLSRIENLESLSKVEKLICLFLIVK